MVQRTLYADATSVYHMGINQLPTMNESKARVWKKIVCFYILAMLFSLGFGAFILQAGKLEAGDLLSVVAMCVSNPDRSPVGINRRDVTVTPTVLAEIVSDDFPVTPPCRRHGLRKCCCVSITFPASSYT
jgi:hypothetical protein